MKLFKSLNLVLIVAHSWKNPENFHMLQLWSHTPPQKKPFLELREHRFIVRLEGYVLPVPKGFVCVSLLLFLF